MAVPAKKVLMNQGRTGTLDQLDAYFAVAKTQTPELQPLPYQ
jgi:hypothetical protein